MAIHLTPTELGREAGMHRREVIAKCMELGVPIFQGRIDKTLFMTSLKERKKRQLRRQLAPGPKHRRRAHVPRVPHRIGRRDSRRERERSMEAVTAGGGRRAGTGSKTIADLLPLAAEKYARPPRAALQGRRRVGRRLLRRARRGGQARSRSGSSTSASSPATRSRSSPTPVPSGRTPASASSPPAARSSRSTRPTRPRSASTCSSHSESRAVFVEDAEQLAKIREVRDRLPGAEPRHRDGPRRRRARRRRDLARRPARARPRPRRVGVGGALRGRHARRHVPLHLHVGHHRPAQGLPAHARQLPRDHRRGRRSRACSRTATSATSSCRSRTPSRS